MKHTTTRRRGLVALFAPVAIAFALTFGLTGCATPADATDENGLWIVTQDDLKNEKYKDALCKSDAFLDYALRAVKHGDPEKRDNTHAPSIPFKASKESAALKEIMAEHCGNPTVLDMTLKGLVESKPAGIDFAANNSWATDFLAKAKDQGLRTLCLRTKEEDSKDFIVTEECQNVAAMTNVLLLRAENAGFEARKSLRNWFVKGDDPVLELPLTVENPKQESLAALVLEFTEKGKGCEAAIGYNRLDKRFELLPCKAEIKVKKVVKTIVTKPGKDGKCKPPTKPSGGKCVVKKTYVKGTTPTGGGGRSEDGASASPSAPAVGTGGGATAAPAPVTPPRDTTPPPEEPGAGNDNGSVGTPP